MEAYVESWRINRESDDPMCHPSSPSHAHYSKIKFAKSPEEDRKDFESSNSTLDRSLPIHCIVEEITSLEAGRFADCPHEQGEAEGCSCRNIETKTCVVIPVSTTMSDLVRTVLKRLGYPNGTWSSALGSILIRNWKPLALETISPGPKVTVGDILGELSTLVTLRIQVLRPKSSMMEEIKDSLLSFLIKQNRRFLSNTGCPLDLFTLSKLCQESAYIKKHLLPEPTEEVRQRFESWLRHQLKTEIAENSFCDSPASSTNINNNQVIYNPEGSYSKSRTYAIPKETDRPKNSTPTKTRMRTSFDPEMELPKLHKWYLENPHPTRQQIYEYVQELNTLESRRGRKLLDVNNVVYWFKNARAAQKRTECRRFYSVTSNVLKIPLGKNSSSVTSEEQRSISDDEVSMTSDLDDSREVKLQSAETWKPVKEEEAQEPRQSTPTLIENLKEERTSDDDESRDGRLSIAENCLETDIDETSKGDRLQEQSHEEISQQDRIEATENVQESISREETENKSLVSYKNNTSNTHEVFMSRFKPGFPVPASSILSHSFMYMSQYMNSKVRNLPLTSEERRKRNRTFIDPVTEVPRLEQWFRLSTHPSHNLIARYTDELNGMPYRRKFPKLETKNVQFWFKNRRAKNKRLNYVEAHR